MARYLFITVSDRNNVKKTRKKSWPGYPKPNHTMDIPGYLVAEYANYHSQWYGRRARAQKGLR